MKRINYFKLSVIIVSVCVCMNSAIASDLLDPCAGRAQIVLNGEMRGGGKPADMENHLVNYASISEADNGAYYLNFDSADIITINHGLSVALVDNSDLYICNLSIIQHVSFTSPTPLLTLAGSGAGRVHLYNVKIAGNASTSSPCLAIAANGASVAASEFSSCSEGVRIAASNTLLGAASAEHYSEEKNVIHDNGVGIHQISGSWNKWPYNSVYANGHSIDDGIFAVGGSRPVVQTGEGDMVELQCSSEGADSRISSCQLQFSSLPATGGEVELYKATDNPLDMFQGKDYVAKCEVTAGNTCIFDASNASAVLSNIDCGESAKCKFVAIFTGDASSMYSTTTFALNRRIATIPAVTMPIPGDVPGVQQEGTDQDRIAMNEPHVSQPGSETILPPDEDEPAQVAAFDGTMTSAGKTCSLTSSASPSADLFLILGITLTGMLVSRICRHC